MNYAASSAIVISKKYCIDDLIHLVHTEPDVSLPQGLKVSFHPRHKRDAHTLTRNNVKIEFLETA